MYRISEFRAKRIDNSQLAYGFGVFPIEDESGVVVRCKLHTSSGIIDVDPETVGQYIGRQDDEGNDLYGGQRVKFTNLSLGLYSEEVQWAEGVITYDPEGSGYFISQGQGDGWNLRHSTVVALDDEEGETKA